VAGLLGHGLHNVFAYAGLQYTTATNGVILNSSVPIMIIVVGWLIYRDTITRIQALGVAISLTGVLSILTRGDLGVPRELLAQQGRPDRARRDDLLGGIHRVPAHEAEGAGRLAMLTCCSVVGSCCSSRCSRRDDVLRRARRGDARDCRAMAYVAIFPSFVGYVFWNRAVAEVGSNVAGIFMHLMPVFGSILAWIFLGERIQLFHVAGIALILGGITLTSRGRRAVPEPGPE
jgi:drug/metabolite transporter (DMT)-like permease